MPDTQTHTHTHTHRPSKVTLAHARQGLIRDLCCYSTVLYTHDHMTCIRVHVYVHVHVHVCIHLYSNSVELKVKHKCLHSALNLQMHIYINYSIYYQMVSLVGGGILTARTPFSLFTSTVSSSGTLDAFSAALRTRRLLVTFLVIFVTTLFSLVLFSFFF